MAGTLQFTQAAVRQDGVPRQAVYNVLDVLLAHHAPVTFHLLTEKPVCDKQRQPQHQGSACRKQGSQPALQTPDHAGSSNR